MSKDDLPGKTSSLSAYDRLSEEYRECVLRCQQAKDQLRACENEMRNLGRAVNTKLSFPGIVPDLSLNIGQLSHREMEIFTLIGCGFTTLQIAHNLAVTTSAIETFRERLKAKLNIPNSPTLTRQAVLWFHCN